MQIKIMSCINCFPSPNVCSDRVIHIKPFRNLKVGANLSKILEALDSDSHHISHALISDGDSFKITDFNGVVSLAGNNVESFTLNWSSRKKETEKITIIFAFNSNVSHITHGVRTLRLPTQVFNGDVWEIIYDKKHELWNLVSLNTSSSLDPMPELENNFFLVGGLEGNSGRKIIREDLNMDADSVLCANGSGSLIGMDYSAEAIANTMAIRDSNGKLSVADGTQQNNAVNLKQLQDRTPIGTDRQVMGYENGEIKSVTLGWKEFSDLPSPPPFPNGVLTGTAFQSDGKALYAFIQLDTEFNADSGSIPMYKTGGKLTVADGVSDKDAVNMDQLNALLARIEALENQ